MELHRNAATCPNSRALIARRVLEDGWTRTAAARGRRRERHDCTRAELAIICIAPLSRNQAARSPRGHERSHRPSIQPELDAIELDGLR
jgi:hypothetical protein